MKHRTNDAHDLRLALLVAGLCLVLGAGPALAGPSAAPADRTPDVTDALRDLWAAVTTRVAEVLAPELGFDDSALTPERLVAPGSAPERDRTDDPIVEPQNGHGVDPNG